MKKLLSLLLCGALLIPLTATAATTDCVACSCHECHIEQSASSSTYTAVKTAADTGDTVTLYITVKSSKKIGGLSALIDIDPRYLRYSSSAALKGNGYCNATTSLSEIYYSTLFEAGGESYTSSTRVFSISFLVAHGFTESDSVINQCVKEFYDNDCNMLDFSGVNVEVEVKKAGSTHTHTVVVDKAVAATCTKTGLTEGSHCATCGEVIKQQTVIEKTAHSPVTVKGYSATCTKTGLTDGTKCSVCGTIITAQKEIPMTEHTPVTIPAVSPTETSTGLTEGKKCSVCGKILVEQTVIAPIGHTHTVVTDDAVAATCTHTGLTAGSHCSTCGMILTEQKTVPTVPHSYSNGKCSVCGAVDPSTIKGIYGDLDGDGSITSADALIVLRASVALETLDAAQIKLADVDTDNEITSVDSLYILRHSVSLSSTDLVGKNCSS